MIYKQGNEQNNFKYVKCYEGMTGQLGKASEEQKFN